QYCIGVRSDWRDARRARLLIRTELYGMLGRLHVLEAHRQNLPQGIGSETFEWERQRDTLALGRGAIYNAVSRAYTSYSTLLTVIDADRRAEEALEDPPD